MTPLRWTRTLRTPHSNDSWPSVMVVKRWQWIFITWLTAPWRAR